MLLSKNHINLKSQLKDNLINRNEIKNLKCEILDVKEGNAVFLNLL